MLRNVSRPARFTATRVRNVVADALGAPPDVVEHLPMGWGNENWRVESRGERLVLKLGPPESAAKWAATHDVYRLGRQAALPVPELVYFDAGSEIAGGWIVRIFTWMEGTRPDAVLTDAGRIARFFTDLATAARALHALPVDAFSSRLDGSAPSFDRWADYVEWRLPQVLDRVRATSSFAEPDARTLARLIQEVAAEVSPYASPSICHRDLHLDNLLATPDGRVAALLDFDGAEAWDAAIDVVKLRWLVFPSYPGAEPAFVESYGHPLRWSERVRLAELLALLNAVPNAIASGDSDFELLARTRLREVLAK